MSSLVAADDTGLAAGAAVLRDRVISVAYNRASGFVTPHFLMLSDLHLRVNTSPPPPMHREAAYCAYLQPLDTSRAFIITNMIM